MENGYCPITLRKKNTTTKNPPKRSQSAPRRSHSSLAVRNLSSSIIRSQKVDEIKKEMEQEKKIQAKPLQKNLKPAIRHRKDKKVWDDEGCLIESKQPPILEKNENKPLRCHSKQKQKNRDFAKDFKVGESSNQSIINRIRPPSRAQSVIGFRKKANNMDEFLDRQNRSIKNREVSTKHQKKIEREQRNKSYMNDESKKILLSSQSATDLLAPRKIIKQDDFSFHPDMSLTSSRSVKDLSYRLNESRDIYFEMSLLESRMEEEAKEMSQCTFAPDFSLTQNSIRTSSQDKQLNMRNENKQNKENQNRKNKSKENAKKVSHVKEVPKRTRYINELLSGLRTSPCY